MRAALVACCVAVLASACMAEPAKKPTFDGTGRWSTSIDKNPLDDSETFFASLSSSSGTSRWGNKPHLSIRRKSSKIELWINWHDYLGGDVYVTTRIGKAKAIHRKWSMSSDSKSAFYPENPSSFITRLSKADTLVAQCTPYGENPITAVFDIRGLSNLLPELRKAKNWPKRKRSSAPKVEIKWIETGTQKIKIKLVNGKEVGRWKFEKKQDYRSMDEKLSAPKR